MSKILNFIKILSRFAASAVACVIAAQPASALTDCAELPSYTEAQDAIIAAQGQSNGGFGLNMWITIVNRDGEVCAVAFSGDDRGDQWPGSRVISAQKASTANSFSLPVLALSTANLWAATQPGGSLFGLQFSNPVDTAVAYGDKSGQHRGSKADNYGQAHDPMVGEIVGGVNVFGGGLALYDAQGTLVGALGVSGDSSCADHNIAWRARDYLGLDYLPAGSNDNIAFDLADDGNGHLVSAGGFGHPKCGIGADDGVDNANVVNDCPFGDGSTATCNP